MSRRKERRAILDHNRSMRNGSLPGARRLDDGEVVFRIPEEDFKVLRVLYPDLVSKDHAARLAAWKELRKTELGERYLVTRTPRQVQKSPTGIIIK